MIYNVKFEVKCDFIMNNTSALSPKTFKPEFFLLYRLVVDH